MRYGRIFSLLVFIPCIIAFLSGCEDAKKQLEDLTGWDIFDQDEPVVLTGNNAYLYLRQDVGKQPPTETQSIMTLLQWGAEGGSSTDSLDRFNPGQGLLNLLRKEVRTRRNAKPAGFQRIDFSSFYQELTGSASASQRRVLGDVDLSALQSEYLIPNVEAVPVKNQGSRGTCAAFTGIGHLEYAVLKQFPTLSQIDLSEQHFYYLSKPECWDSGCSTEQQGSWYGSGYNSCSQAETPTVPRESDCPYNAELGDTDLQLPEYEGCQRGAVKILSLKYVQQPDEIIRVLENDHLPVPYASPLSGNWEQNSGLITFADSGYSGSTQHAGGHAYLIVGYKKLPSMPEEGGMCFIIKNSWGPWWGSNGFACMTLKWMQNWTFGQDYDQPIVMDVAVDDAVFDSEPLDPTKEEDQVIPDLNPDIVDDNTSDTSKLDTYVPDEVPDPEPDPFEITWKPISLRGPGDNYFQAEYADQNGQLFLHVVLRGSGKYSNNLELSQEGEFLIFDGDRVGELRPTEMVLCSESYDLLCSLRFDETQNTLKIEFVNPEYRRVPDSELPEGSWFDLLSPITGYALQIYSPSSIDSLLSLNHAYIRLGTPDNKAGDALRLGLDGDEIKVMGTSVGKLTLSFDEFELCSGNYSKNCSMFASTTGLQILPTW
jgi:hypothetical protein